MDNNRQPVISITTHVFSSDSGRCEFCDVNDQNQEESKKPCAVRQQRNERIEERALRAALSDILADMRTDAAITFNESDVLANFLKEQYHVLAQATTPESRRVAMSCLAGTVFAAGMAAASA